MGAAVALLPVLSSVAGAAGASGAVMTGLSVAGGLAGMASAINQGNAAEAEADYQARQIGLQGRLDAIATNEELLKTLASNKVAAVSGGLAEAGSVEYAKQSSMANAAEAMNLNRMNTQAKQQQVLNQGKLLKSQSIFDAIGQGVSAADTIGQALNIKKKTTG